MLAEPYAERPEVEKGSHRIRIRVFTRLREPLIGVQGVSELFFTVIAPFVNQAFEWVQTLLHLKLAV